MNYNNPQQKRQYQVGHLVVGLLFCIFCFVYLWKVQGSMMGMAQQILSNGVTVYNPMLGAAILTVLLGALQVVLNRWLQMGSMCYALTYFPSFLLLSYLTSVNASLYDGFRNGHWTVTFPLLLFLFFALVSFLKHFNPYRSSQSKDWGIQSLVSNVLILMLQIGMTCSLAYNQKPLQYQNQLQTALLDGDYQKALTIGQAYRQPTRVTSALRAYALAHEGLLAESLFDYAQPHGSEGLWIPLADTIHMQFPLQSLYTSLGAYPSDKTTTAYQFLRYLHLSARQRTALSDEYWLMAQLLDRQLPVFVQELDSIYGLADSVSYPRHYREALVLYKQRCDTTLACTDSLLEKSFQTYSEIVQQAPTQREARSRSSEQYRNTYWWYYDFQGIKEY